MLPKLSVCSALTVLISFQIASAVTDKSDKFAEWLRVKRQIPGLDGSGLGSILPSGLSLDPSSFGNLFSLGASSFASLFQGSLGGFGGLPQVGGAPSGGLLGGILPGGKTAPTNPLAPGLNLPGSNILGGNSPAGILPGVNPGGNVPPAAVNPPVNPNANENAKQSLLEQLGLG